MQESPIFEHPAEGVELDDFPAMQVSPDSREEALPAESLAPTRNGKVSFFSWDQIEEFTSHIERANAESKDTRTVRALLAVSQWLDPKEHNPLSHPKCGIRALTGHPATTDFEWVSPSDVMQTIAMDDGLPLLTAAPIFSAGASCSLLNVTSKGSPPSPFQPRTCQGLVTAIRIASLCLISRSTTFLLSPQVFRSCSARCTS